MIKRQRLTDPVAEPITVDEARAHLRIDDDVFDVEIPLVEAFISAARDYCENYCNRAWASATWLTLVDRIPTYGRICMPDPATTDVTAISYLDAQDSEKVIDVANYSYDDVRQFLIPVNSWPSDADYVAITYTAGPDHSASPAPIIPKSVISAMKLVLTDLYENRSALEVGTIVSKNPAVEALLNPYRVSMGI